MNFLVHNNRNEALALTTKAAKLMPHLGYARVFGSHEMVPATLAICANSSAVREW